MENFKLVNQVLHLTSTGFLVGTVVLKYFFNTYEFLIEDRNFLDFAQPFSSVTAFLTGFASAYYLRPEQLKTPAKKSTSSDKEQDEVGQGLQSVWKDIAKIKFVLSLLLTPLVDPLVLFVLSTSGTSDDEETGGDVSVTSSAAYSVKVSIQFWVVVTLLVLSFGAKVLREDFCNNFKEDPINKKLEQIKMTYQNNADFRKAQFEQQMEARQNE